MSVGDPVRMVLVYGNDCLWVLEMVRVDGVDEG